MKPEQTFGIVPKGEAVATSGLTFLQRMLDRTYPAPPFTRTTDI